MDLSPFTHDVVVHKRDNTKILKGEVQLDCIIQRENDRQEQMLQRSISKSSD